jgi:ribA/ribD-fused uncharacterized protein
MRFLITGGREFTDVDFIVTRLLRLHARYTFTEIITGMARGVDRIGYEFGVELGLKIHEYPVTNADWNQYGKSAGFRRNQRMLYEGQPGLVVAFPGGGGTADMVKRSMGAGVPVWRSQLIAFNSTIRKYEFLSNFAKGFEFVDADGCVWPTTEHYYHSRKTEDEEIRGMIQMLPGAADAKQAGKLVEDASWTVDRKIEVMREALAYKFAEGSKAADLLLGTHEDYLREHAPWGDLFWGTNGEDGLNHLGHLLMERRDILSGA